MLRSFKELDLFRKLPAETQEAKAPDSSPVLVLRLLTYLAIGTLVLSEFWSFITPQRRQRFDLDMHSSINASATRKIRVLLNITVHDFPCIDVSLDYQDVMGTRAVDVKTTIFKQRLYENGSLVEEVAVNNDPKVAEGTGSGTGPSLSQNHTGNTTCGNCYGALPPGNCCNTCGDVLYAYRLKRWALPRIESIYQCKNDGAKGSASAAYQPPQIMKLSDYNSKDFIPKFHKIGNLTGASNEAKILTPFTWHFDKNTPLDIDKTVPVKVNKSDEDDADLREDGENSTKPWPNCVLSNVVVHGYDSGDALMVDLSKHGAKSGCWNDDCTSTDKFVSTSMEQCAEVCEKVAECKWWTHGNEDGVTKCWIRTGHNDRQRRYGFSSGARTCRRNNETSSNKTSSNETSSGSGAAATAAATAAAEPAAATAAAEPAAAATAAAEPAASTTAPPSDGTTRRLQSFGYDDYPLGGLTRSFMPMFESAESRMRKEQQGESCRLHGYFDTNKVPGNFHIGTHGTTAPSYLSYYQDVASTAQSMQHDINSLAFVEVDNENLLNSTQALDGFQSPKAFTFQYYLTVSPATVKEAGGVEKHGYQFRAGSFVTNEMIGPAVFFRMDIDPIRVTYYTEEASWSRFLVNICAVVGGCIAITSMFGQVLDATSDIVSHKD